MTCGREVIIGEVLFAAHGFGQSSGRPDPGREKPGLTPTPAPVVPIHGNGHAPGLTSERARLLGQKGGPARSAKLAPEERTRIAFRAAQARWRKPAPATPTKAGKYAASLAEVRERTARAMLRRRISDDLQAPPGTKTPHGLCPGCGHIRGLCLDGTFRVHWRRKPDLRLCPGVDEPGTALP